VHAGSASTGDFVSTDTVSLNTTGVSGTFSDKNVGTNKTVQISGLTLGGTDASNYNLIQPSTTASIMQRTLKVSATAANKTYDGTTTAAVTLSTDKVSGDYVNVSDTSANFADPNVGTGKTVTVTGISITGGADAGNYSLGNTTATTSANIAAANTTTTLTAPSSEPYGGTVTFKASVTANSPTPTGSVQFKVNGSNVGSAQTLANGSASYSYQVMQAPGTSLTVSAVYTSDSANWNGSTSSSTLSVTTASATTQYSGNSLFWGSSATASSATATLSATISDGSGFNGDIKNAKVSFTANGTTVCSGLSVGYVSSSDTTVGTATCNATLSIGSSGATQYTIAIMVNGGYYSDNNPAEDTVIDVADPITSNFITGGGFTLNQNSGGIYPGDLNQKTNFGFNVKYNSSGTNLQGNINIIDRSGGRVYQVKGNSMTSLGVKYCQANSTGTITSCSTTGPVSPCTTTASATCPIQANFNGKASIQDITNPASVLSIDGNATLQVSMTDRGAGNTDSIGITVWNKSGGMWFSNNWNGTQTLEQLLGGGNLSAH
jgi:hypothetical protein